MKLISILLLVSTLAAAQPGSKKTAIVKKIPSGIVLGFVSSDIRFKKHDGHQEPAVSSSWTTTGWKGEKVHTQIMIKSATDLMGVTLGTTNMSTNSGRQILSSAIIASFIGYVTTDGLNKDGGGCGIPANLDTSLVADVISTKKTFPLKAGQIQPVWLSIKIPENASVGLYHGQVKLYKNGITLGSLGFTVTVNHRILPPPKDWKFALDLWQNPYSVARVYHVKPWSDAHFNLMRPYMKMLAAAGQKAITTTIITDPWNGQTYDKYQSMIRWVKKRNGTWTYDYHIFDQWVSFMISCGIDKEISCYSLIPWDLKYHYDDETTGKDTCLVAAPGSKAYEQHWKPMLKDFAIHLKKKGWFSRTMISMDERPLDAMLHTIKVIKGADSQFKISLAGNYHPEIENDIADYSVASNQTVSKEKLESRRKKGYKTTYYTCCTEGTPNTFTFSPPAESTWIAWYALNKGFDGYLRWAYNCWNENPLKDSRYGSWSAGDSFFVYPENSSSIRFERLIEGIQDAEKVRLLQQEFLQHGQTEKLVALRSVWKDFELGELKTRSAAEMVNHAKEVLDSFDRDEENAVVDAVNPLIGTAFAGFEKGLEGGGTMPSVNVPFAMTNFVAQTGENKMGRMCYQYEDQSVIGLLATHQPTVWMGDYGYVSVMPQVGSLRTLPKERALSYSHADEIAKPYYYSVKLKTGNGDKITSEIAGANSCGMFRFTFPAAEEAHLIIQGINLNPELTDWANDYKGRIKNLKGYVHIDTVNNEITGYNPDRQSAQLGPELKNFKGYFIIRFDKQIKDYGTWDNNTISKGSKSQFGTRMGAYISFKTRANEQVKVVVATSFISIDQARENLQKEITGWDFEKVVKTTRGQWQKALKTITIAGVSKTQRTIFYTALYHTMLFPRQFSEYGKYYSAFDDQVHRGVSYTDYSLWDTFRALHPLLIFTQPDRINGMVQSLVQMYKEGGWMPMWPNPTYTNIMIGTHADAVVADAFVKGFHGFEVNLAYAALHKDSFTAPDGDGLKSWGDRDLWTSFEARGGLSDDRRLGYVPADKIKESVSRTIEYSIDDYCVAQMANKLGKKADYLKTIGWSKNYKNVYHPSTGFMAARYADGQWSANLEEGFTEGTKWTYTFGAMHDISGMMEMMGGKKQFAEKLLLNFDGGHYRADNEPGHHYLYLFNYCGMPWKTQELVRQHTSEENFRNLPAGINGNDDCGQTSAWYIFNVMGFYPVAPASGYYSLGAPQFPSLELSLTDGRKLLIKAVDLSEKNKYVKEVSFNGKIIKDNLISHQELIKGGTLVFKMTGKPLL